MNLHDVLMKKAQNGQLAHFYILETSSSGDAALEELTKFTHQFIRDYYQKIEGAKQSLTHLMNHPDVYVLGNLPEAEEKEDSFFTVEESEHLARFFEFKPVQGKRKFAVITEGHRINNLVANKWLKLFEEPQGNSTIFLLNPRRQKLLDTVHSRAQHLRLPSARASSGLEEWDTFLTETKSLSLCQFLDKNAKQDKDVFYWSNQLIRWEAGEFDHPESKIALTEWIKKLQEMETFHQPSATKWTLFYSYLQAHVLPRLSR